MLKIVFISFLVLALTAGRGWVGDVVGQSLVGLTVGSMLSEGFKRIFCGLLTGDTGEVFGGIIPFIGLSIHAYAFAYYIPTIYLKLMIVMVVIGAVVWGVYLFTVGCQALSKAVVDGVAHISHNGG